MTSVVPWKSGTPFSIRSGSDSPGLGNVDSTGSDRPNVVESAVEFIQPLDSGGNFGRNTFRKNGVWNIKMAFSWRILLPKSLPSFSVPSS